MSVDRIDSTVAATIVQEGFWVAMFCVLKWNLILASLCCCAVLAAAEPESIVDFGKQVQPLLAEKCFRCHGVDNDEGGLRLHRREDATRQLDSEAYAIVPGKAAASALLERVTSEDDDRRMPPEDDPLSAEEVQLLARWIDQGADFDVHWAYRPLMVAPIDLASWRKAIATQWVRARVDAYVLANLMRQAVPRSSEATRGVLIKRLYYDLIGLPPTAVQVDEFTRDVAPDAYERLVDRLLASPHFAERWGRHWLDVARYADSDGYEKDNARPNAWRYRDWVLDAINVDLPFDQFSIEQLAGDLLTDATSQQRLATAFHRQTLTNTEGGTNPEQWRVAAVMDRTETLGAVWLGLTVGCARCHSHKYDQLSQAEYYQLFAFFNNADEINAELPRSSREIRELTRARAKYLQQLQALQAKVSELETQFPKDAETWERRLEADARAQLSDEQTAALAIPAAERDEEQQKRVIAAYQSAVKPLTDARRELAETKSKAPVSDLVKVRIIGRRAENPRETRILRRGEFQQPLDLVQTASLSILPPIPSRDNESPDRLDLARWLVSSDNPLAARVAVNHVWQHLFGQGLVTTPNDFGVRGERPSHPRLLDYLAQRYREVGWSRKALIREIVLSATYRQSSLHRPELAQVDPLNRLLYRQNRYRVEAEILRDLVLGVSGLLDATIGGPSVFPPMPPEIAAISYANSFRWNISSGGDRYRRGLYTFFKRTAPHPTLLTFDCPDANVTNVKRNRSNTPLGALTLMNNVVFAEAATEFADRVMGQTGDDRTRIAGAMKACIARTPRDEEVDGLLDLLAESRAYYRNNHEAAHRLVPHPRHEDVVEQAAWTSTLRVVLNLDEFITRE